METVPVPQAPAIPEAPAAVVRPVGGATMAALPFAVQDLARFFLNPVGGVAAVAASASGVGAQLCPPAPSGMAVSSCVATALPAGVSGPPAASGAVPGSSGHQQRQEVSRSRRRRHRLSSNGTG